MRFCSFIKIILVLAFFVSKTNYAAYAVSHFEKESSIKIRNTEKKFAVTNPPKITATGDQIYCPGTAIKIATSVTITPGGTETGTDAVYIQISSGYINGLDLLLLSNPTSHLMILASWSPLEGKLKLSSPTGIQISYSDFEAAIKDVTYSNASTTPSGTRDFSINLGIGNANYLPRNGHFYEYVQSVGITWTAARDAAALRIYYGLKGYLATLTAPDETQLAGKQAPGAGWIGGSDEQTEGVWKWVTGPEAGTTFWNGLANGSVTPPFNFAFWNTGEPNQSGNEDYAHITAPGVGNPGSWNDLSNTGSISGNYQPKGYIVEYGGMGEAPLQISTSTKITIPKITSATPNSRCGSGNITLTATATDGTINWYASSSSGTILATGETYSTVITNTTTYFVDAGCSSSRIAITATVINLPDLPVINTTLTYCLNAAALPLTATASVNCTLKWYSSVTAGTSSSSSPTPSTATIGTTSYFVSQINNLTGCESVRAEIKVTINARPLAPAVNAVSYCKNETAAPLTATVSPNCTLNWYESATAGTPSSSSAIPSTTTVGITSYFVSQTAIDTGCESLRSEIKVTINDRPLAPVVIGIRYCKDETARPVSATASTNCTLNWYTSATGGISSTTSPTPPTTNVGSTSYFVSQRNTNNGCEGPRAELIVIVSALPVVSNVTVSQCDTDAIPDGKTRFNLTVNNNLISVNYTSETFTYYKTLSGANHSLVSDLITNDLAFENTAATGMSVWARVANNTTGCYSVAKLTLIVPAANIPPTYKIQIPVVCDDNLDTNGNNTNNNNNRDGIASFDLTASKATIRAILPITDVYNINYYRNRADALEEHNPITNLSNYRNIGYPNLQDIWVRVDSNLDNACYGIGPYITLKVEALPKANSVVIPKQCDDNQDGIYSFDTSTLESRLLNGQTNVTVTYFDQNNNPLKDSNGVRIATRFPNRFSTTSQNIKAVLTNNTSLQCSDETFITFKVDDLPEAFSIPLPSTTICDDEANPLRQDGKFAFNTTLYETTILGGQTGMITKYLDQNGVLLASPLPNPFVTGSQKITVSVENPLNSTCIATTTINFVVNPIPNIDLNLDGKANELVCSNLPTFFVTLNAGILDSSSLNNYTYVWKKDGTDIPNNAPTLGVNTVGVYTVEVLSNAGCSRIRTITVDASNVATIDSIDIVDLTETNTVTVNTSGTGNYEYRLDDPNNFWQDSNFFDNVPAGIHEIFINDKNGCGIVSKEIIVVSIPKYFTPNNDSYNDAWGIKGMSKYPLAVANIFDRFGKLIITLNYSNPNWDGTINGNPLPSDDYWFTITLEKDKPMLRGHFTLKR